jgi:hypothetical protein
LAKAPIETRLSRVGSIAIGYALPKGEKQG